MSSCLSPHSQANPDLLPALHLCVLPLLLLELPVDCRIRPLHRGLLEPLGLVSTEVSERSHQVNAALVLGLVCHQVADPLVPVAGNLVLEVGQLRLPVSAWRQLAGNPKPRHTCPVHPEKAAHRLDTARNIIAAPAEPAASQEALHASSLKRLA